MIHEPIKNALCEGHWAVGSSLVHLEGQEPYVLAQLQNFGDQTRVALSADAAEEMAHRLLEHAALARKATPLPGATANR